MAKREETASQLQALKAAIKEKNPERLYIFHGEESYLREFYLGEMRKKLVPAGFEEFNYHAVEGKNLTMQALT